MKHRTLLLGAGIALLSIFLLSGCGQKEESSSIKVSVGDTSERECLLSKDCGEGFHCVKGECISNDVLNNFQECANNECTQPCTNCEKGEYVCMHSSESFKDNKCVECFMNLQCNPGYACKNYVCVAE